MRPRRRLTSTSSKYAPSAVSGASIWEAKSATSWPVTGPPSGRLSRSAAARSKPVGAPEPGLGNEDETESDNPECNSAAPRRRWNRPTGGSYVRDGDGNDGSTRHGRDQELCRDGRSGRCHGQGGQGRAGRLREDRRRIRDGDRARRRRCGQGCRRGRRARRREGRGSRGDPRHPAAALERRPHLAARTPGQLTARSKAADPSLGQAWAHFERRRVPERRPRTGRRGRKESPMLLGKVVGTLVATRKEPSLDGIKFLVLRQLDIDASEARGYRVAADAVGAGLGEVVLYATGSSARMTRIPDQRPCGGVIMAIVDQLEVDGEVKYDKSESG